MKPNQKNDWILNEIEFTLCANMLGRGDWDHIPVLKREQPLEQRMLDGVMRLAEMGLLLPAQGQTFQPSSLLLRRMQCIIWPERLVQLIGRDVPNWRFFRNGPDCMLVEPVLTEPDGYRVMELEEPEAELLWACLQEREEGCYPPLDEALEAQLNGALALLMVAEVGETAPRMARILERAGQIWLEEEQTAVPLTQAHLAQWLDGKEGASAT